MDFSGKKAIVTGGANGIGKEVVRGIVEGGGYVTIADINQEAAERTIAEFGADRTSFTYMDLGNHESIVEAMNKIIAEAGKIDILVNCAGIISAKPFDQLSYEEWERTIRINLSGCFSTISTIFPHFMEQKGGRIVNVSSVAAKLGGGLLGTAAYASSKAGLNGRPKVVVKKGGNLGLLAMQYVHPLLALI